MRLKATVRFDAHEAIRLAARLERESRYVDGHRIVRGHALRTKAGPRTPAAVAYALAHGEAPGGRFVRRTCGARGCIASDHLALYEAPPEPARHRASLLEQRATVARVLHRSGLPNAVIARTLGMSRSTVKAYCYVAQVAAEHPPADDAGHWAERFA